jgi:hypothetical protein
VIALPPLVSTWGVSGAALATVLGHVAGALVLVAAFLRVTGYSLRSLFVCTTDDLRWLRDGVYGAVGRTPRSKQIRVTRNDVCGRRVAGRRQVIVTPDVVHKFQEPAAAQVELVKTRRAQQLGRQSGLFEVPKIIHAELGEGLLVFERTVDIVPLSSRLSRGERAGDVVRRAALALAFVHDNLRIPPEFRVCLPPLWQSENRAAQVALHGDFNVHNVWVHEPTDRLVILDWATTDHAGPKVTQGPWCFDAAWFIGSMFIRRWGSLKGGVADLAHRFISTYVRRRGAAVDPAMFAPYMQRVLQQIADAYQVDARGWTDRLRNWSRGRVATGSLAGFLEEYQAIVDTRRQAA